MKKEKIFVALILLAAFVLRFWHLEGRMAFDADQETVAWIVKGILVDHKMTLVGIPSSVGGFQLAPLYMYLSALFYWLFQMNPLGVGVLSIIIFTLGLLVFYFFVRKSWNQPAAFICLIVASFSFNLVLSSQIAWPVIFMFILAPAFLYYLYHFIQTGDNLWILVTIFALGLHSHFSTIFFLATLVISYLVFHPKVKLRQVIPSFIIFPIVILPLIIFELRHGFLNSKAFLSFFTQQTSLQTDIWQRVGDILIHNLHNLIWPFYYPHDFFLINWLIVVLFFIGLVKIFWQDRKLFIIIFIYLVSQAIFFMFYRGPLTEYYFLTAWPIFILVPIIGLVFIARYALAGKLIAGLILGLMLVINLQSSLTFNNDLGLRYKKEAVKFIINDSQDNPFRLSISTTRGYNTGYSYLFYFLKHQPVTDLRYRIYTIVVPPGFEGIQAKKTFGGVGVLWEESFAK